MPDVETMITELLKREGGYVNDPSDPGGATKYGITIHTLSAYRKKRCTPSDVRALTQAQAREIYLQNYYQKPKISALPAPLQPSVFDMYVNAGNRAVKLLQQTLNKFGAQLKIDGSIGPRTLEVSTLIDQEAGQYLVDAYGIERREFYYHLADQRPASRKYARTRAGKKGGWITRAEEFISPHYRLSDAAHQARIQGWG